MKVIPTRVVRTKFDIYVFIEIKIFWTKKTTSPSIFLYCEKHHDISEILLMLTLNTNQSLEREKMA